ncbi:hypothetical protein [Nitrincola alkalilacustris]|uniref:hypothetical protein n=1 Tax=Nitrincola alkalilacustris TaxID=1571224 RepID=UPI00124E306B|nr:hypothetical protein [Nitrincola alkalilacustris]
MSDLKRQVEDIVYYLRTGEVAYAYHLYPAFLASLISALSDEQMLSIHPLLNEMLTAQAQQNSVWLADLLEYMLFEQLT